MVRDTPLSVKYGSVADSAAVRFSWLVSIDRPTFCPLPNTFDCWTDVVRMTLSSCE